LEPDDEKDAIVRDRLTAVKKLYVHRVPEGSVADKIVELSNAYEQARVKVLIYTRTPELAQKAIAALIKKLGKDASERLALLTGTIRGHERDQLVRTNKVYRAFLEPGSQVERTVYLVSTSAGEVGIDLDADHLVCDLTTLDGLIQRLGRVNRRGGEGRYAKVDLVVEPLSKLKLSGFYKAINGTLALARLARRYKRIDNGIDVSPASLRLLFGAAKPEWIEAAFPLKPEAPPLTDILLDSWSLTSIEKLPGRPEVSAFLHGLTHDPPETFVVWRKEISLLRAAQADDSSLRDWFRALRVEARERLRDRTDRVRNSLADLLRAHREREPGLDFSVVLLDDMNGRPILGRRRFTLREEIGRRRLERAATKSSDPAAAHELITFIYAGHSDWDTPNYSAESPCVQSACTDSARVLTHSFPAQLRFAGAADKPAEETVAPGSNNWAVAGVHTRSGVALIANDMHLDLGVPTVWYPARLRVTGDPSIDVTGVTLPGTPAVAAGSNGQVAWGFTNSYGDFADARWGKCASAEFGVRRETIAIKGETSVEVVYRDVGAGVVLDGED
jgi:hypothetical protein